MGTIPDDLKKTKEMENFEKETGKRAIWRGSITETFKKWQKGEDDFDIDKERISLYVSKDIKDEWLNFASNNEYSTLSKLIREALKFFIEYRSKIIIKYKNVDIDLLSSLSHDLKEPLTSIKGYLQLIIETHGNTLEDKVISIIKNVLGQCSILENKIIDYLDKFETEKEEEINGLSEYDLLLIEDDVETVNLLTSYFDSLGFSCKGVLSGFKGLKELKRHIPKLILLDIILPDINGYEVLKRIRADSKLKDIPVFFLTAIPNIEVEKKITKLGTTGAILKPFNLSDFDTLHKYLNIK
ncbi:MAG: response regulator [Candidatus Lokiarchaeota archaeon]|nr:response regulator [Candidatus Lokiarchaeota archaeon]